MKPNVLLRLIIVALLACISLGWRAALACSCAPVSLESRYERSENVFTAVITGGQTTSELVGNSSKIRAFFEVTESFKGSIPFEYLSSHAGGSSCGISLEIGVEYLVFAPDTGGIGLCSGIVPVSWSLRGEAGVGLQYVAALQALKSGTHDSLAEPWQFVEIGGGCYLSGSFPYGERKWKSSIGVTYWTRIPDGLKRNPDKPHHGAGFTEMSIFVPGREDLTDHPLRLRVNDRNYTAHWKPDEHSAARYFVDAGYVPALIADLAKANELKMMLAHPTQGELQFEASLLNVGDSVEKMLACIRGD